MSGDAAPGARVNVSLVEPVALFVLVLDICHPQPNEFQWPRLFGNSIRRKPAGASHGEYTLILADYTRKYLACAPLLEYRLANTKQSG